MTDSPPTISFFVTQLTPHLNSKDQIRNLCKFHGPDLQGSFISDKPAFLFALSGQESSFGAENVPRYEFAYGPGGLYYQKSRLLKTLHESYGALISCSWGPWQIMAIVAMENQKFFGHPAELHNAMVSCPYVVGYLNFLISKGADTIEKLAAAYNAGPGAITNPKLWPTRYVQDFLRYYDSCVGKT